MEYVDYYFGPSFDVEFTDWDDLETVRNANVIKQNFVLLASEHTTELIGTQLTATKLSRHRRSLEDAFNAKPYVDYFAINNVDVEEETVSYNLTIGSDELNATVYVL